MGGHGCGRYNTVLGDTGWMLDVGDIGWVLDVGDMQWVLVGVAGTPPLLGIWDGCFLFGTQSPVCQLQVTPCSFAWLCCGNRQYMRNRTGSVSYGL